MVKDRWIEGSGGKWYYLGTVIVRNGYTIFIPDDVEAYKKANSYSAGEWGSIIIGFTPLDAGKDTIDFIEGEDTLTGEKTNRGVLLATILLPEVGDIAAKKLSKWAGKVSAKELIGKKFEEYLTKTVGGEGSFSKGGRDFDGGLGNRWWEAKSGQYWDLITNDSKKLELFKSSMGDRVRIAKDNGATYELFSNTAIPQTIKDWLTKKGIPYTELSD